MLPLEVMAVLLSVLACVRVRVCASELALERACSPQYHELLLPEGAPSPYPGDAYLPGARKLPAT